MKIKKYSLLFFACLTIMLGWSATNAFHPELPSKEKPIILCSNQHRNDLRLTIKNALNRAEKSIFIVIFSLSDQKILKTLQKKSKQGIKVKIICEPSITKKLRKKLKAIEIKSKKAKGLMHKKIIIIDNKEVWLGSTNLTTTSLVAYDNLLIGLNSPQLAKYIAKNAKATNHFNFHIKNQKLEFWSLPENKQALNRIIKIIDSAQKNINVAMFTWTHYKLANAIINAQKRGVKVNVILDYYSSKGASSKITKQLKQEQINVGLSLGIGFLHHKFMCVDDKILVNGSANWTKAAFTKNDDCFLIIKNMTKQQQKFMKKLWKNITLEANWK